MITLSSRVPIVDYNKPPQPTYRTWLLRLPINALWMSFSKDISLDPSISISKALFLNSTLLNALCQSQKRCNVKVEFNLKNKLIVYFKIVYKISFVLILMFSKSMLNVFPPAPIFTTFSAHSVLEKLFSYRPKKSSRRVIESLFEPR